jgi:hypothetical protein
VAPECTDNGFCFTPFFNVGDPHDVIIIFIFHFEISELAIFTQGLNPYKECHHVAPVVHSMPKIGWKDILVRPASFATWRIPHSNRTLITPISVPIVIPSHFILDHQMIELHFRLTSLMVHYKVTWDYYWDGDWRNECAVTVWYPPGCKTCGTYKYILPPNFWHTVNNRSDVMALFVGVQALRKYCKFRNFKVKDKNDDYIVWIPYIEEWGETETIISALRCHRLQ